MGNRRRLFLCVLALALSQGAGAAEFDVDPLLGSFRVVLRKQGLLKALGHDHAIEVKDYSGHVSLNVSSASLRLEVLTDTLVIDTPEARQAAGFSSEVTMADRVKIRESMRGEKGLDVLRYPRITFAADAAAPAASSTSSWKAVGAFGLHGTTRTLEVPVTLEPRPDGWWVSGAVRLKPSDFGIAPFSVAGLIKVKDEAEVTFRLVLKRSEELYLPPLPTEPLTPPATGP